MTSFKDFAEHTNNDYIIILSGMVLIGFSTFGNGIIGDVLTIIIKLIGVIVLAYAVCIYISHLKSYFIEHPNVLVNSQYAPYRQNILASCGVCIIILGLLIYSIYTIFV